MSPPDRPRRAHANSQGVAILAVIIFLGIPGCASTTRGPYAVQSEIGRDPQRAQALNLQAADLLSIDPERAETLLTKALAADLYHGPTHNNLGVLYLEQGKLYEAASEFEWARKLLPGHPDPRLNLAVALERAGKIDDAMETYRTALEVYPGHLPTIQALVRCQIRHGRTDDSTRAMLEEITLRSTEPSWIAWSQRQHSRLVEN